MKISVIIAFYKDHASLNLVLQALTRQTYNNFEVVVAEDDDDTETRKCLSAWSKKLNILHLQQPDTGRNKLIAQNRAIAHSNGEYLVFIDGDIILFSRFLEYTIKAAKPGRVLSGRRVNLTQELTSRIKRGEIQAQDLEKHYWKFYLRYFRYRQVRAEQGFQFDPQGWLYRLLFSKRKRNTDILGCNFSCYKQDIIAINGFDEDYHPLAIIGDDTDLTWRFKAAGFELFSAKNIACCFHLWHRSPSYSHDPTNDLRHFEANRKAGKFYCDNGVDKYLD